MNLLPIEVTAATPFILYPQQLWGVDAFSQLCLLEIANDSGGQVLYYGDLPGPTISVDNLTGAAGQKIVSCRDAATNAPSPRFRDIKVGMYIQDDVVNNTVVRIWPGGQFEVCTALVNAINGSKDFLTPLIDSYNGIPIAVGGQKSFTTDGDDKWLNGPLYLTVATGTATVRIRYKVK